MDEKSDQPGEGGQARACMYEGCDCPAYVDALDSFLREPGECARCGHAGSYHVVREN